MWLGNKKWPFVGHGVLTGEVAVVTISTSGGRAEGSRARAYAGLTLMLGTVMRSTRWLLGTDYRISRSTRAVVSELAAGDFSPSE